MKHIQAITPCLAEENVFICMYIVIIMTYYLHEVWLLSKLVCFLILNLCLGSKHYQCALAVIPRLPPLCHLRLSDFVLYMQLWIPYSQSHLL